MSFELTEHMHESEQKQAEWEKQKAIYKNIEQAGGLQAFVESLPNMEDAFHPADNCVHCMDERVVGGKLRIAGSGCLASFDVAVKAVKDSGADGVWSHKGCAAAAAYAQQNGIADPEQAAIDYSKKLAEAAGVEYKGHEDVNPNFHNARAMYYDGTGSFDPKQVPELPNGFVFSRRFVTKEQGIAETELAATKIAPGAHGYGNLITTDAPFYLIPVADPENPEFSLETLTAELKEIEEKSSGLIKIMGFTKPVQKAEQAAA